MVPQIQISKSARETQKLGERLATSLSFGKLSSREKAVVICLYGDLGAGKTTFVQGLARGLGIRQRITSPTFVLVRPYNLDRKPITFYHIDLYRIEKLGDTRGLGLEEILTGSTGIVAIEWAEKAGPILPRKRIEIKFENIGENERKITTSYKDN